MAKKPKRGPNYAFNKRRREVAFARAKRRYRLLLHALGPQCAECGEQEVTLLSIDHVDGITWDRRSLRYDARVSRYIAEHKSGVRLRVLCLPCNGRDGRYRQMADDEVPF